MSALSAFLLNFQDLFAVSAIHGRAILPFSPLFSALGLSFSEFRFIVFPESILTLAMVRVGRIELYKAQTLNSSHHGHPSGVFQKSLLSHLAVVVALGMTGKITRSYLR